MPRQQSILGTDIENPIIADMIERWLDACEKAKRAKEAEGDLDDAIVVKMLELGIPYHPYIDPETGKRKYRIVDTTPRGKSIAARPVPKAEMEPDEPEVSEDVRVESRKVSRKAAQKAIAEAKPKSKNGAAADVGSWSPARSDEDYDQ